jgi:hypothetical protein
MDPPFTTAAILLPSLEEAMDCHTFGLSSGVRSVHETPESSEVQMPPLQTPAARYTPSVEEATESQSWVLPTERSIQVARAGYTAHRMRVTKTRARRRFPPRRSILGAFLDSRAARAPCAAADAASSG